jgi:two-component system sensor histidine kinase KdpD
MATGDTGARRRGNLTIYLGYAAGVGKTYQMLEEGQSLKAKGHDVVIGYFEPHGRKDTIARTEGLEMIPRRRIEYRGSTFEEMDPEAILRRIPEICLVDEFPHTNVPGSAREKRWQDVMALIDAGINVFTTMNIQHLESLNDQVFELSGVRVRETVPDWVVRQATEVVMVDLTPRALLNRLIRGVVYPEERARRAMENFFKDSTLSALREMALREAADEVNVRYVDVTKQAASCTQQAQGEQETGSRHERILVYLTADATSDALVRRAKRVADYLRAECTALFIHRSGEMSRMAAPSRAAMERALNFARSQRVETRVLEASDVARALVDFARIHQVTHIFLPRPHYGHFRFLLGANLVHRVVRLAKEMEIIIVAPRGQSRRS